MAINKKIVKWSDDEAFKALSYVEIYNLLLENYRAIYGSEVDFSAESPIGQELRMKAQFLLQFSELAEYIYYTLDVNHAHGPMLDNLVAFTSNLERLTDRVTTLTAKIESDKTLISNEVFFVQDSEDVRWRITKTTVIDELSTPKEYEVEMTATEYGELLFTLPAVQVLESASFYSSNVTVSNIVYNEVGSIKESDAMLRMRKNNTISYNSLTVLDSIRDQILKNIHSVKDVVIYNSNGRATDGMSVVENFDSTISLLLSDDTSIDNVVSLHDIFVVIQPQPGLDLESFINVTRDPSTKEITAVGAPRVLARAIAETIRQKLTPGIATAYELLDYGTQTNPYTGVYEYDGTADFNYITVPLTNDLGSQTITENIRFYVANPISPKIEVTLLVKDNYDPNSNREKIREALYKLSKNYTINKDIDYSELFVTIQGCNVDPLNPAFIVTGVTVNNQLGTPNGNEVLNGYWLVDDRDGEVTYQDGVDVQYPDIKIVDGFDASGE